MRHGFSIGCCMSRGAPPRTSRGKGLGHGVSRDRVALWAACVLVCLWADAALAFPPAFGEQKPGNLYITLSVEQHEFFTRDGDNILYKLPINFAQAALGAEIEVPTLNSKTKLKLPAGSQTGKVFRLKDKGIPHLHRSGRGDQLVTLLVVTPESLTKEQRQLFQELADSLSPAKRAHQKP